MGNHRKEVGLHTGGIPNGRHITRYYQAERLICCGNRCNAQSNGTWCALDRDINFYIRQGLVLLKGLAYHAQITTTAMRTFIFATKQFHTFHTNHLLRVYAKEAPKGRVDFYKAFIVTYNGNTIRTGDQNRTQLLLISSNPVKEFYVLQSSGGHITEIAYNT